MKNLCSVLFLGAICFLSLSAFTNISDGYGIGDQADDFKLKNIDGQFVSMSDFDAAKGYIVIFTCNTCPYSVLYEDRIIKLHNKYASAGYPVIAINPNDPAIRAGDDFTSMKKRASEKSFDFPYLFDEDQTVFPKFGATRTPHVFILDQDLVVKYIGAIDDNAQDAKGVEINFVDTAIAAMNVGIDPDPSFTKAIGCSIKSKMMKKKKRRRAMKNSKS